MERLVDMNRLVLKSCGIILNLNLT